MFDPNDDLSELLNNLPPDALQQMLGLGTLDDKQALLDRQYDQAGLLGQPGPQHSTPVGAALGGLGDVLGKGYAIHEQKGLMGKMGGLIEERQRGRNAMVDALRQSGRRAALTSPNVIAPIMAGGLDEETMSLLAPGLKR